MNDWDEKNDEALSVISFTVSDQLQGPIPYEKTAKGAWDELQHVHASNDKQRKFSPLRRLYRLDMLSDGSLSNYEKTFDTLMQSLSTIGKDIDPDELIILYANSLPVKIYSNWIQSQMAFIDKLLITEFKGHVREEARRLNLSGLGQGLGVENNDPDTIQANYARSNPRIFPPRKANNFLSCKHCGFQNHIEANCHKCSAEEYYAKQVKCSQNQKKGGGGGKKGRCGGGNNDSQAANLANANASTDTSNAPTYNSIFDGLAFCLKATVNYRIR